MAGQHGSRSNYADKPATDEVSMPHGRLPVNFGSRTYDPTSGSDDGEGGTRSSLFEHSLGGDWSWQPQRYKADPGITIQPGHSVDRTASLEEQMPTFKGVPKGAAELYRGQVFTRA